jgi:hypothetical protein
MLPKNRNTRNKNSPVIPSVFSKFIEVMEAKRERARPRAPFSAASRTIRMQGDF